MRPQKRGTVRVTVNAHNKDPSLLRGHTHRTNFKTSSLALRRFQMNEIFLSGAETINQSINLS